jgi:hypothetical protein
MKRLSGLILLIAIIPILVQCGDYETSISYGRMDCTDAVVTTDVFTFDSLNLIEKYRVDEIDDFGMANVYFNCPVKNGCPGDSVTLEFTCHLVHGSPINVYVTQTVVNNLDETVGSATFASVLVGNDYEITSRGRYLAPKDASDTEFTATVALVFESSGDDVKDMVFLRRYFKDLTVRFTYSKISD